MSFQISTADFVQTMLWTNICLCQMLLSQIVKTPLLQRLLSKHNWNAVNNEQFKISLSSIALFSQIHRAGFTDVLHMAGLRFSKAFLMIFSKQKNFKASICLFLCFLTPFFLIFDLRWPLLLVGPRPVVLSRGAAEPLGAAKSSRGAANL